MFSRQASRTARLSNILLTGLLFSQCGVTRADDAEKKPEKVVPKVAMCVPLAVPAGETTKVIVRGWGLEGAMEIRSSNPQLVLKILTTAKATIPNKQDAKQIGDTQIEIEVTVPKETQSGEVELTIVQSDVVSSPHKLLIGCGKALGGQALTEQEPNDGFNQAQSLQLPQTLDGQIAGDGNVDVFSFEVADKPSGKQQIIIEVFASRYGSNLDSILTLFDQRGNIIAVNDDLKGARETKDSKIISNLPAGKYFLSLQDAHDRGGPAHPYRLTVTVEGTERE